MEKTDTNQRKKRPVTDRRVLSFGAILGGVVGGVFSLMYVLVSAWLCSGNLNCPSRWESYFGTFLILWPISIVLAALGAWILFKLFQLFKVD